MAELRIGVLGPLEVFVDGRRRSIPPGRQRAVLYRLLVHAGRPVSADALIDAAWQTDLPLEPHRALRTVLSRLRTVLGRDSIEMTPSGYRLAIGPSAIDSGLFIDLLERARTAEPVPARDLLRRALALWRGAAYGEYEGAPFAAPVVQRLEQLRSDGAESYAAALLQTGEPAAAIVGLEELLVDQPFREYSVELLALALYHAGRQTEALQRLRDHRELLAEELGLDPPPALSALEDRILGHTLPPHRTATGEPPHWLDTSTAFIGREDELADLVAAVPANRVTVITGPGGVGKSRLAAEAMATIHHRLGLPTTVVELVAVPSGCAGAAIADALGLRADDAALEDDLVEYLTAVPQLLVLDNCEHVLAELASLVVTITRRCRDVRVLATSRHRLGISSELLVPLAPLPLPDPATEPGSQGAVASVRLFTDRVRRLRPAFTVTRQSTAQVAELCRGCDGLPLALELAASRTATSGVADVLARFPADLDAGADGVLRAVVAWSAELLQPEQRSLLDLLSVFAGEFTATDVRGLTNGFAAWEGDCTAALAELVESSLVAHRPTGDLARYRLLQMVRGYGHRSLRDTGRTGEARQAHAEWVRQTVTAIRADWPRADGVDVAARLSAHSSEIAAALRWSLDAGHLELAADISHAVARCLHWTAGLEILDLMIAVGERCARKPSPRTAPGISTTAFLTAERGDTDRARMLAGQAIKAAGSPDGTVLALLALAVSAMYAGRLSESARWFRKLATIPGLTGEANTSLALIACYTDDFAAAERHVRIALAARPSAGDAEHAFARYAEAELAARFDPARGAAMLTDVAAEAARVGAEQVSRVSRVALFALLVRGGRTAAAADLGMTLFGDLRRFGVWNQTWTTIRLLAELLADLGRWSDAAFLLAAAQAAPSCPPPMGQDVPRYSALQTILTRRLGPTVVEQISSLAATVPRAQVLSRAERLLAILQGS